MIKLLAVLVWLEIIARIVTGKNEPHLLSLFASEPCTDFDRALYDSMGNYDDE